MRFALLAAVAACGLSVPAGAAVVVNIHADATGTRSQRVLCPGGGFNCQVVTPVSQTFDFNVTIPDFVNGQSFFNFIGATGYVNFSGGQLFGTGFNYYSNSQNEETHLQAATFSVLPVSANIVPEPATWAMMLTGFGLIGYGMRRRQVQWISAPLKSVVT